eukprot:s972_g29.t1
MERANARLQDQHARTIPITSNLVALIFVSLSNLTQDQRQVLTSLMAHRIRVLADYRLNELREVYLEIFCTTKTSVDNPLLAPSDGGRKKFLVIDEGYLDSHEGYWVEDEEDGTEGFLEADEDTFWDTFWVYDDENYTWFQRRFQRKKDEERIQRRSPKRERQGRQRIRRKTLLQEEERQVTSDRRSDRRLASRRTMAGQSMARSIWDDWSWYESEEAYAAKGKGKKGKKGK